MTRQHVPVLILILILSVLAVFTATPVHADGVVTNCNNDTDFSSKLSGGGTVTFNCGTATIVLSSTKTITVNTTIDGGGTITLSGDNARHLFVVNPGARLELHNIVIEKGFSNSGDGGAIRNLDTLIIANSKFLSNTVTSDWSGGAIYSSSHLAISDSTFSHNQGGSAGAIHGQSSVSQMNIFSSTFDHNQATNTSASGFGGALLLADSANATVMSSTFSQNQARKGGAVDARSGSRLTINDSTIRDNLAGPGADAGGGGIDNDASTVTLTNVTLSGNSAGEGGGIDTFGGALTLNKVTLSGNSAIYGAGVSIDLGTHTLTNVTFSGNTAHSGGGIYNSRATLTLINVTLAGNSSDTGLVGGIVNSGSGPDPNLNLRNVILVAGVMGDNCAFTIPPNSSEFNLSDDNSCSFGESRDGVNLLLGPIADNGGPTKTHLPQTGSPAIDFGTNTGCPATDQRGQPRPVNGTCDVGAVERQSADGVVTQCSDDADLSNKLSSGGTVTFNCGTATIVLSSTKTIAVNTTIDGGGIITLSGDNARRLFVVNNGVSLHLKDVVLEKGNANYDGAIYNNGSLALDSATIRNSVASENGGAINTLGSLDMTNSTLANNTAKNGGALFATTTNAHVTMAHSAFHDNQATGSAVPDGRGGAIVAFGGATVNVNSSDIYSNTASNSGGALSANYLNASVSVADTTFSNNQAVSTTTSYGGAIWMGEQAQLTFTGGAIISNSAHSGGGLYVSANATVTLAGIGSPVILSGNSARTDGGGLWNSGTLMLTNATLSGNSAGIDGGGIFNSGTVTLTNATLSGNSAETEGGGLNNYFGTVTLMDATLSGNSTGIAGGGLDNFFGIATLTNATLSSNSAGNNGGGLYNDHGSTALNNVTLSGNTATGHGGALYHIASAIDQVTRLKNTIVANSPSGGNCYAEPGSVTAIVSNGFNLSSDASCPFNQPGDWNSVAANLGPLALNGNGGPTLTHIAFPPSRAVDGGSGCPAADQRGMARPQGLACDIGAVEYVPGELSPWLYLPLILR